MAADGANYPTLIFVCVPLPTVDVDDHNLDLNVVRDRRSRDTTMKAKPVDTLLAFKTICLAPDLNTNDRRVGAALIDHFNRQTGRCDPGIDRLTKLLNISRRTVIRSINALVSAGWLVKVRHGGRGNRNRYEPNWRRLREFGESWNAKMKSLATQQLSDVSPPEGQSRHLLGDEGDTQTLNPNLPNKTCWKGYPRKEVRTPSVITTESVGRQAAKVSQSAFGSPSAVVARTEAERRWHGELFARFDLKTYSAFVEAIGPDLREAATDAELKKRGAGLNHILQHVKLGDGS
jgi:predicted transcriptional regulator